MIKRLRVLAGFLAIALLVGQSAVFAETSTKVNNDGFKLVATYADVVPEGLKRDLLYTKYGLPRHYLVMMGKYGNVRTKPSTAGSILRKMNYTEKYGVLEAVSGQSISGNDLWYKVFWYSSGKKKIGYIHSAYVVKREYNFDLAYEQAQRYKAQVEASRVGRISNFRNVNGAPPKYKGTLEEDPYHVLRYQASAAYIKPDLKSEFRYIQDGRVVQILSETGSFFEVSVPDLKTDEDPAVYYILKKYVSETGSNLKQLNQVIFVDRKQQNEMVLSYENEGWRLVSYTQATTGAKDDYRNPTDLGLFMVLNKKPKFDYLDDETKLIDGYAPYAIRFNGGAFIHGVPVSYVIEKEEKIIKPAVLDASGKEIKPAVIETKILSKKDPGEVEYLSSIGTVPRSHKCVRNYTSHAKFLYDWIKVGQSAVVVFE